jgi:DNA repair protein RadC
LQKYLDASEDGRVKISHADTEMTKALIDVATRSAAVHDHIIVGKNDHASLKGLRLI